MKGNQLLRKAHSMFGWDWGPQTIDAGIFRDIYLQGYSHARIEDIRIHQQHAKNVSVQTSITLSESVPGSKPLRGTLRRRCRQTAADETV